MTEVLVATFNNLTGTQKTACRLWDSGAAADDVCALESQHQGLIAVRVGDGCLDKMVAGTILAEAGGHPVYSYAPRSDAANIIHGLRKSRDPFQPPESFLPPLIMQALSEADSDGEQPPTSRMPFGHVLHPKSRTTDRSEARGQ